MGSSASTNQESGTEPGVHSEAKSNDPLQSNNFRLGGHTDLNVSVEPNLKAATSSSRLVSSDGYKWRKYGQKSVKGSKFPRSYYKCTFPGCNVKKFVEKCEENGEIVENVFYKGENRHTHDSIVITRLNAADQQSFKKSVIHESQSLDSVQNATPRLVIETASDVDHLDDGYNWRKYGQKNVKGSPHPRSYYRCTDESCPVKKQVEKRGNTIINTYEGTHNHCAPGLDSTRKKKRKLPKPSETTDEKTIHTTSNESVPPHNLLPLLQHPQVSPNDSLSFSPPAFQPNNNTNQSTVLTNSISTLPHLQQEEQETEHFESETKSYQQETERFESETKSYQQEQQRFESETKSNYHQAQEHHQQQQEEEPENQVEDSHQTSV